MKQSEIIRTQERVGAVPDGFWGPKSVAACQAYLRTLMPVPHPFPKQQHVAEFYGPHGEKGGFSPPTKKITLPFTIYYTEKGGTKSVRTLFPHERCADSLLGVFDRLAEVYPDKASREAAGVLVYDGLYNPRKMRGGAKLWSMHAWAIAIELNASRNGNKVHWPTNASMPIEVMECFCREGWTPAGAFWGRDAMHFQATSV
jgi:hypothetical protein